MVHWAQGVRRKVGDTPKFAKYDYGKQCVDIFGNARPCNQDMYGTQDPPVYNLKDIKTPIAIFSGPFCCCFPCLDVSLCGVVCSGFASFLRFNPSRILSLSLSSVVHVLLCLQGGKLDVCARGQHTFLCMFGHCLPLRYI